MKFCFNCGQSIDDRFKKCPNCRVEQPESGVRKLREDWLGTVIIAAVIGTVLLAVAMIIYAAGIF